MTLKEYQVKYINPLFPSKINKHLSSISHEFSEKDIYTIICNCHLPIREKTHLLKLLATIIKNKNVYDIFITYDEVLMDIRNASFEQNGFFYVSLKDTSFNHPIKVIVKNKEKYYINVNKNYEVIDFYFIDQELEKKWNALTFSYVDMPHPLKEGDIITLNKKQYVVKAVGVNDKLKPMCDFIDACITIVPIEYKDDYTYHDHISILNLDYE